jgi:Flp pilus assembly protein TadG
MMIEASRKHRAALRALGTKGAALVEFAFIAPVLLLIVLGTAEFGIALGQFVMLTNAVGVGAMQFASSRGEVAAAGPPASGPYTDAVNAVRNAAPILTPANLTITLSVNGTACATDAACKTALDVNIGQPATVSATYAASFPCNLLTSWYGFASTCNLGSQVTERVQ